MNLLTNETGRPVWARPDLFPPAPTSGWGYLNRKGIATEVADLAALQVALRQDEDEMIGLVWTPQSGNLEVPEEFPELLDAMQHSRLAASRNKLASRRSQLNFGLLLLLAFLVYSAIQLRQMLPTYTWGQIGFRMLLDGTAVMGVLGLLMFFLQPWYEEWKRFREVRSWSADTLRESGDLARFEIWMGRQKVIATRCLMGLIAVAGAVQVLSNKPYAAALVRGNGERWPLLTAPFLHFNSIHFIMNALGLLYLGRRIESLARWPHVPMVFLFSAWIGGEFTLLGKAGVRVLGASGGIMGMLGFLLVFEVLHAKLVPRSAKRRLMAALVGTALIGLIGIQFIDNLAHAGGFVAGCLYAGIVFPKSDSVLRPRSSKTDLVMGYLTFFAIAAAVAFACSKMLA